jgi:23S rRNA pseudouridine1911/1915/1917 synthase
MIDNKVIQTYIISVDKGQSPERIDSFLTRLTSNATRNKVQHAIDNGSVLVNNKMTKSNYKVRPFDEIQVTILKPPPIELIAEDIPIEIIYEDDDLLIVNKPAGLVTHPGFGNRTGTLINAVLFHVGKSILDAVSISYDEDIKEDDSKELNGDVGNLPELRPGIVHRLDKDTTGIMVVAKNFQSLTNLAQQFANRTIERRYWALAWGKFKLDEGMIEGNIARSKSNRKLMAVTREDGKIAITHFKVLERFDYATLLELKLETGRTHQIRVHTKHIGNPLFGDKDYGGDKPIIGISNKQKKKIIQMLDSINRQALHAKTLGFKHPRTKEYMSFNSDLPDDMKYLIEQLRLK